MASTSNILEAVVRELTEYKKSDDISPENLLMFAYDIANIDHESDDSDAATFRRLNWINDNSTKNIFIPLSSLEFLYRKNKSSSLSRELVVKTNGGVRKTFYFRDILKARSDARIEISKIMNKILSKYEFNIPIGQKIKRHGESEDLDDEIRKAGRN